MDADCNRTQAACCSRYDQLVNARFDADAAQSATGVLLVRPANFGHNTQTSASNRFQRAAARSELTGRDANAQFERLVAALCAADIRVCVVDDTDEPAKPDAVFPNNWVSFHRDGTIVLYPMLAANRRTERRMDILDAVERTLGFQRRRVLDFSPHERQGRYLEGTGSLVLDHTGMVAYACRSARTDEALLQQWSQQLGFEPMLFEAVGVDGTPIYHTNVLMSIGSSWAVVCPQAIAQADRSRVLQRLGRHRALIEISSDSMAQFAANILELRTRGGVMRPSRRLLVLSHTAQAAWQREPQAAWDTLCSSVDGVIAVDVPTIEAVGGGGVRCMLAEVPEVTL